MAFWLAGTPGGRAILQADNYLLARSISNRCLNYVKEQGPTKGESVASRLAEALEGQELLVATGLYESQSSNNAASPHAHMTAEHEVPAHQDVHAQYQCGIFPGVSSEYDNGTDPADSSVNLPNKKRQKTGK